MANIYSDMASLWYLISVFLLDALARETISGTNPSLQDLGFEHTYSATSSCRWERSMSEKWYHQESFGGANSTTRSLKDSTWSESDLSCNTLGFQSSKVSGPWSEQKIFRRSWVHRPLVFVMSCQNLPKPSHFSFLSTLRQPNMAWWNSSHLGWFR